MQMMDLSGFVGKRICAAVSGGADSVVLLYRLKETAEKDGFSLSAVNCEHGIRGGDSLADSAFVAELCRRWEVPLFCFSADCPSEAAKEKVSLETAARNFRYRSFQSLLDTGKADYIATAHHAGDEAETVLFRLCRGASLTGAGGISPRRPGYLRPLLDTPKEEILRFAEEKGLPFREDKSNFERNATRNKLRLDVLPLLESAVPGAADNLVRFASLAAEDDALLYEWSESLIYTVPPESVGDTGFRVRLTDRLPLFRRAALTVMKKLGVEKDYTSAHLNAIASLCAAQTGSRVSLPYGLEAARRYDAVAFFRVGQRERGGKKREDEEAKREKIRFHDFAEGTFDGGRYEIVVSEAPLSENGIYGKILRADKEKIPRGAYFRLPERGDCFEKFGGGGRKFLKKYLVDRKIPAEVRAELPVLAGGDDGEIYAVCGVEISEKVKCAENSRVLYIAIRNKYTEVCER